MIALGFHSLISGQKRKISLKVFPLPKYDDGKKFQKFVSGLDISHAKTKKVSGMTSGLISFETDEQQEEAMKKLMDVEVDGNKIQFKDGQIEIDAKKVRYDKRVQKTNNNAALVPESISDVVTAWHKIPYEQQLVDKGAEMTEILKKITSNVWKSSKHSPIEWTKTKQGQICCEFEGLKASPLLDGYRNKVEFSIGYDMNQKPAIGFLLGAAKNGIMSVATTEDCKNVSKKANEIRQFFQTLIEQNPQYGVWDKVAQCGFLRLLTLRTTEMNQSMATLQINPLGQTAEFLAEFKQFLASKVNAAVSSNGERLLDSLYLQHHDGISNAASYDAPIELVWGETHIYEKLFDLKFRIAPSSFFQTNTGATEILYSIIKDWAGEVSNTTVLDVYCGTGTIGITMCKAVERMIGIEVIESAVEDAKFNAELNNLGDKCEFVVGKAEDVLSTIISKNRLYAKNAGEVVAIVDPPRMGLHQKAIRALRECASITRLIYVSCNPASLVDNAGGLCKGASNNMGGIPFVPIKAVAVDLFPHTPHCELVMLFERANTPVAQNAASKRATTTTTTTTTDSDLFTNAASSTSSNNNNNSCNTNDYDRDANASAGEAMDEDLPRNTILENNIS